MKVAGEAGEGQSRGPPPSPCTPAVDSEQVAGAGAHLAGVPAPPPPGEVAPGAEEGGVELEPGAQPGLAEAGLGRAGVAALVYVHDHSLFRF